MTSEERMTRCCDVHDSWDTLLQHLCRDFPTLSSRTIDRCTGELRRDVAMFNLPADDELAMAELALRNELEMMTGERVQVARIMPETHKSRQGPAGAMRTPWNGVTSPHALADIGLTH